MAKEMDWCLFFFLFFCKNKTKTQPSCRYVGPGPLSFVFPLLNYLLSLHTAEPASATLLENSLSFSFATFSWKGRRGFSLCRLHATTCSPGDISIWMYCLLLSKTAWSPWNVLEAILSAAVAFKATSSMYVLVQRCNDWQSSRSVYFDTNFLDVFVKSLL